MSEAEIGPRTRLGYWQAKFANGYLTLEMPVVLELDELQDFDALLALISRQIHRWANDGSIPTTTETNKQ